MADKDV